MKKLHIIVMLMIVVGIGLLVSASQDLSTYANFADAETGKRVKVVGELVKEKPMNYDPSDNPNYFSFFLQDEQGESQKVILNQPKPQDFELAEQVVVTGKMVEGTFRADHVLTKCPSKYKDEEIAIRKQS